MRIPQIHPLLGYLFVLVQLALPAIAGVQGPPLIPRQYPDGTVGAAILYLGVIPEGETLVNFSFFNNTTADRNWITPLLLQGTGGENYKLVGIGESRQNAGTGVQTFPFNVKFGSALAAGPNHVFGWWSGRITQAGNTVNLAPNTSIIRLDTAPSTPGFRESCIRPNQGPCNVIPNPFTLPTFTFGNLYSGPNHGSLAAPYGRL